MEEALKLTVESPKGSRQLAGECKEAIQMYSTFPSRHVLLQDAAIASVLCVLPKYIIIGLSHTIEYVPT